MSRRHRRGVHRTLLVATSIAFVFTLLTWVLGSVGFRFRLDFRAYLFVAHQGNFEFYRVDDIFVMTRWTPRFRCYAPRGDLQSEFLGGGMPKLIPGFTGRNAIQVPMWLATLTILGIVALMISRRRAVSKWACPVCEYDLRGNTSGKCPECGTPSTESQIRKATLSKRT
jgi:hypothetical protein